MRFVLGGRGGILKSLFNLEIRPENHEFARILHVSVLDEIYVSGDKLYAPLNRQWKDLCIFLCRNREFVLISYIFVNFPSNFCSLS